MATPTSSTIDDAGLRYNLLLSCPTGLSPSQVSVNFDASFDRIPHPDTDLENSISEIWSQRIQKNPSFFNGTKFRYAGHKFHNEGGQSNQTHRVCLHLGLTDYKTFMGTNLNPLWERFLVPSEDDSKRCQHTASPLGNGAVVETSDKKIIALKRSDNVGEFPGFYVFPGGHPEPQEIGIECHQAAESHIINRKVSQEMFDSITREVVEEIGVPASSLGNPLFIGISRRELNVRPTVFFFMTCNLQSDQVQQCYSSAQDGYESTQLHVVSTIDLENLALKMPGCHRGGLALYKLMKEAGEKAI